MPPDSSDNSDAAPDAKGPSAPDHPAGFFDLHRKVTRQASRRVARGDSPGPEAAAAAIPGATSPPGPEPITVTQLTRLIDRAIRAGMPQSVLVKGELSSYKPYPGSGHHYFTLKDAGSCLDGVLWRDDAAKLRFAPKVGMEVLASGRVQVYVERGKYQFYATSLQPLGQGVLELAFRQLKEKLEREGLFEPERKKPLPPYPARVVLVTSRQTAALQDMLKVLRSVPWVKLCLYHVPVQGESAGRHIAAALRHLGQHRQKICGGKGADVILLGRGGGSPEDLWCFNDEAVARAVAASVIPIVTGIGHEVDTSIADLVADYHAHTPTEAAQVVARHWRAAPAAVVEAQARLRRGVRVALGDAKKRLAGIERHETFRRPLFRVYMFRQLMDDREKALALLVGERVRGLQHRLNDLGARVDAHHPSLLIATVRDRLRAWEQRLGAAAESRLRTARASVARATALLGERHPRHRVSLQRQRVADLEARFRRSAADDLLRRARRLDALARQLDAVGPEQVLRRGFSLTTLARTGEIVRSVSQIKPGDRLVTRFADGQVEWTVEDPRQPSLFR